MQQPARRPPLREAILVALPRPAERSTLASHRLTVVLALLFFALLEAPLIYVAGLRAGLRQADGEAYYRVLQTAYQQAVILGRATDSMRHEITTLQTSARRNRVRVATSSLIVAPPVIVSPP